MANEDKKDFNVILHDSKDMPKMKIITDIKNIEKYGGSRMYLASLIDYDILVRRVPFGKVITIGGLRDYLAQVSHVDFTEPITVDIFISTAAWASVRRRDDPTPYWRTLKTNGELDAKCPGGVSAQKEKLGAEGHTVICGGRKNIRYFVKGYKSALFDFTQGEQAS